MSGRAPMLRGDNVNRIYWQLGTDQLLAVCFCGAQRTFEEPAALWEWLLGHPDGHHGAGLEPLPVERAPVAAGV